ncbi:hypothetical protein SAMN04488688_102232 [Paenibacillus sp. cl141a]|uniref:hypothetical protein n=1 Tax=Paenibacillus sp. cl141a TaxID=1761877 RepID=UPI0008CAB59E|nr:hypothetical protein [Paenibacillus sp. cl141a]SEK77533.1 hypothetical protein SAMN04488688_102232 [Paenibacillus sp. cl141a]
MGKKKAEGIRRGFLLSDELIESNYKIHWRYAMKITRNSIPKQKQSEVQDIKERVTKYIPGKHGLIGIVIPKIVINQARREAVRKQQLSVDDCLPKEFVIK